jgi:hypothetical protein
MAGQSFLPDPFSRQFCLLSSPAFSSESIIDFFRDGLFVLDFEGLGMWSLGEIVLGVRLFLVLLYTLIALTILTF